MRSSLLFDSDFLTLSTFIRSDGARRSDHAQRRYLESGKVSAPE
jgi:hypothetical protein